MRAVIGGSRWGRTQVSIEAEGRTGQGLDMQCWARQIQGVRALGSTTLHHITPNRDFFPSFLS